MLRKGSRQGGAAAKDQGHDGRGGARAWAQRQESRRQTVWESFHRACSAPSAEKAILQSIPGGPGVGSLVAAPVRDSERTRSRLGHAQRRMQGYLGLGELFPLNHELHVGLPRGLGHGQDVDVVPGQGSGGLGQDAGLGDVGADGADNGHLAQGDMLESVVQLRDQRICAVPIVDDHADGVGVGGLADIGNLVFGQNLHDAQIESDFTDHARVMDFQAGDLVGTGHNLDHGLRGDEILADEGAAMIRVKGIFDPNGNIVDFQRFGCLGMNGLHAHVGQLVGHVEVGVAQGVDVVFANENRIA